ncbi:hypothetical protein H696_05547 [Fonticula alba]|uniref:Defect at low temperature protein 1 n=1 Tax=Fonticula alba TaxID=691883 RepID=A0A058Z103_FONAL|nr:hypothetical protein H696_05547 [Fonticula alba]KCV67816.1 hypothetical protein H696_05547 [Fonticula alba]|eukprot:XP_009497636.1 hypothetical protein H696_05547 [Fonticula alba]
MRLTHRPPYRRRSRLRSALFFLTVAVVLLTLAGSLFYTAYDLFGNVPNVPLLLVGYGTFVIATLIIIADRLRTTRLTKKDIPRDYLPLQKYHIARPMLDYIHQSIHRNVQTLIGPVDGSLPGQWGLLDPADLDPIHFPTSLAMSFQLVEQFAMELGFPGRPGHCTVRRYLLELLPAAMAPPDSPASGMDMAAARRFVELYERASYGNPPAGLVPSRVALLAAQAAAEPGPGRPGHSASHGPALGGEIGQAEYEAFIAVTTDLLSNLRHVALSSAKSAAGQGASSDMSPE